MRRRAYETTARRADTRTIGEVVRDAANSDSIGRMIAREMGPAWDDLQEVVARLAADRPELGWAARSFVVVAACDAAAPPDPPPAPNPHTLVPGSWRAAGTRATRELLTPTGWSQRISLPGVNAPVAVVRRDTAGPRPIHRQQAVAGRPATRSQALLPGVSVASRPRPRLEGRGLGGPGGRPLTPPVGRTSSTMPAVLGTRDPFVVDGDVPDGDSATWSVWVGDWIGRWGPSADVVASAPPRPAPPAPVVSAVLVRSAVDGSAPASAGTVAIEATIPAVEAPGGRPVVAIEVDVDGVVTELAAPTPLVGRGAARTRTVRHGVPAPTTEPGDGVEVVVAVRSVDAAGNRSASDPPSPSVVTVHVTDARPVPTPTSGPRLIVAGPPGPDGLAAATLTWPVRPGAASYRVYVATAGMLVRRGLDTTVDELTAGDPTRAALGAALHERSAQLVDRQLFRLDVPAAPGVDGGIIRHEVLLAGATDDVTMVRVVSVSATGVESPFAAAALSPVVVPRSSVPPPPVARAAFDPVAGSITLSVVASGLDEAVITASGGGAPIAGLWHHSPDLPDDALYRPAASPATVELQREGASWRADVVLDAPAGGWARWVEAAFVARVRFADEPTSRRDIVEEADVAGTWSPAAIPMPWSAPSVPAAVTPAPSLATPIIEVDDSAGARRVTVAGVDDGVRLQLFADDGTGLVPIGDEVASVQPTTSFDAVPVATRYGVLVIDPLGRTGPAAVTP